jgi:hypothetical protein
MLRAQAASLWASLIFAFSDRRQITTPGFYIAQSAPHYSRKITMFRASFLQMYLAAMRYLRGGNAAQADGTYTVGFSYNGHACNISHAE